MVIRTSSRSQLDSLIADLSSDREVTREAAIARLRVLGVRAAARLTAVALDDREPATARQAALRALEGVEDARSIEAAARTVGDADERVALASVAVLRTVIRGRLGLRAVEQLSSAALASDRPRPVRLAAIQALRDLDAATVAPLVDALSHDADQIIRQAVQPPAARASRRDPLASALEGRLPADPSALGRAVAASTDNVSLPQLHSLLERIRERERSVDEAEQRAWITARGAVHTVLARRGSHLGVYDLRETLERAKEPLPVEFLAALTAVGDPSCLEAFADGARSCVY